MLEFRLNTKLYMGGQERQSPNSTPQEKFLYPCKEYESRTTSKRFTNRLNTIFCCGWSAVEHTLKMQRCRRVSKRSIKDNGRPIKPRLFHAALTMTMLLSLGTLPACAQGGQTPPPAYSTPQSVTAVPEADTLGLPEVVSEADALNRLGLFSGSEKGYELERIPTRAESLVMLLKLTGQAQKAESGNWNHPFQDGGWASPYIGYAYTHHYTSGLTETEFGTATPATAQQYAVFLLRALGYTINEDYTYEKALSFFLSHTPARMPEGDTFTRGDMVSMSMAALAAPMRDGSMTLAESLSGAGLFSMEDYRTLRDAASPTPKYETTVLVYMVGSNLESHYHCGTDNILEMLDAPLNESVPVILQTGGAEIWHNDWITDGATQRFQLAEDTLLPLSTLDGALMSTPDTLSNFLHWGVRAYPAQRYILILWNHGGGTMRGFGIDDMRDNKLLSLGELSRAMDWADTRFDLVGFDACLMNTLTTAYLLRDHANYLLASQEEQPKIGWDYEWLTALSQTPDIPVPLLSERVIDGYISDVLEYEWNRPALSLIDLKDMDAVMAQWQHILEQLHRQMEQGQIQPVLEAFRTVIKSGYSAADQLDLTTFLNQLEVYGLADTAPLRQLLEQAIVCIDSDDTLPNANGLSVYLPYYKPEQYRTSTRDSLRECGIPEPVLAFYDEFLRLAEEHRPPPQYAIELKKIPEP